MDLKELITFRTIIEEGTFSKAAEKLHYAQSTVTNQIQRLEKELGLTLFKRGWDAELTESGKIYAKEVNMLINHWYAVAQKAAALQKEEIGNIHIGISEILIDKVLPNALKNFSVYKPKVSCHFVVGNTDELSKKLMEKPNLDFVISGEPMDMSQLQFQHLYHEEIKFIVHGDHPLTKEEGIELSDLITYPLVTGGSNCLYRLQLERELSVYKETPFFHSISQISAIPAMITQNDYVGVVLSSTPLPQDVVILCVKLINPLISIGILQSRHSNYMSETKKLLLQCFTEEFMALTVK
ncbi:DNA-binding transcriptional LysR family regulator [Paenibacillus turicensis]|uniref:DNA-binding transcriptional LysR family regulator n=2 Tax=Paenibacillus turicensis TaxID=160487 RepID=A0ABS4FQ30_9BACL|nr:DNA-binding transcriptional LysR family regulator [Paenibacillus turicensis]